MAKIFDKVIEECKELRSAGQAEYAHSDNNCFENFESDSKEIGISREKSLLIFANKHWRGIRAWANGHQSQREDVRGRINDLIVYLILLRGMIEHGLQKIEWD
jgi:hypothetical protein